MMYTGEMKRAFRSLDHHCPKSFYLTITDEEYFLNVIADEKVIMSLPDQETKLRAVQYMFMVKKALEANGAIVNLTRTGGAE